jgi:dTDP-4-amino-4,6-dideoxygalactose transaminase
MKTNPYKIVQYFEETLAEFVGSKYAVAVDNCSNALFLCCKYLNVGKVTIPAKTYVSVPCSIIHAGGEVEFEHTEWSGSYQLAPYPIYDSACKLSKGMYMPGTLQCISFSGNKPLKIGKGGMIFTDNTDAFKWFKLARYEGRNEISIMEDEFKVLGWNMYMTPEQAARGLVLASYLKEENVIHPIYPDLSKFEIYKAKNNVETRPTRNTEA